MRKTLAILALTALAAGATCAVQAQTVPSVADILSANKAASGGQTLLAASVRRRVLDELVRGRERLNVADYQAALGGWVGTHLDGTMDAMTNGIWLWSVLIAAVSWTLVQRYGEPRRA